ncbi:MAG TPA: hypothetical protein PLE19_03135 [Planctomycetota bacterium]|nr:hypothetical protein [Planctomycetota bacterium]HRR80634.1 hypothetical protein [Planctomycetota bacterium]HRT97260.1 hypothetical protein [Planctomycetota bacterium]
MARSEIYAGICGFRTLVRAASADGRHVRLKVESQCPDVLRIRKRLEALTLDAYTEVGPCDQPGGAKKSQISDLCRELPHLACPVPPGIFKALEVAAGLALPRDASIRVFRDDEQEG